MANDLLSMTKNEENPSQFVIFVLFIALDENTKASNWLMKLIWLAAEVNTADYLIPKHKREHTRAHARTLNVSGEAIVSRWFCANSA